MAGQFLCVQRVSKGTLCLSALASGLAGSEEDQLMLCTYELRTGLLNGIEGFYAVQRCNALANSSGYCPVHDPRALPPPEKPPRRRRDLDADVLPWATDDWASPSQ